LFRRSYGEIPGTCCEIEYHVVRANIGETEGQALPGTVSAHRHEVVRQVVTPGNPPK
jgi:hypothetical protein